MSPELYRIPRLAGALSCGLFMAFVGVNPAAGAGGTSVPSGETAVTASAGSTAGKPVMYIREYRVAGATLLSPGEIGETVYPYLGPGRTAEDVEKARAALEKAYHDKGFQTVSVQIPVQQGRGGVVQLEAVEAKVGRLRVRKARFFLPSEIKRSVPALAEGTVPNFNDVTREIVALNQLPDRRITPELRPGKEPGTVDIDLQVEDKFPMHGSLELNNRYSPDTSQLRLNGSLSYSNLWQLGHTLGGSFQISPEKLEDVKVYSAYYLARFREVPWLSVLASGTKQDSNVSTLGGVAVAGRGEIVGARALIALPPGKDFYQSLSAGMDYKHFKQAVTLGLDPLTGLANTTETPISYYPITVAYNANWFGKGVLTELNLGVTFHLRGMGSEGEQFDTNRFKADGSFVYLRGDLAHTRDLPLGFELFAKVQGQIADQPLVSSEQISGGGLNTVRGYLEAEVVGDNGVFGSVELRSPSLLDWVDKRSSEWRVYAFCEGGLLSIYEPLPEQTGDFELASIGVGTRIRIRDFLNGSLDAGLPLFSQSQTESREPLFSFRVWAEF
jgi:hemolysin activation/secretion protein